MRNPFELLGLATTASVAEVKTAYRALARAVHPDRGGNPAAFANLNTAYEAALKIAQERPCHVCKGLGWETESHGFMSVSVVCSRCSGSGKAGA